MTYATEAQKSYIRRLSGTTVEAAAQNYGFAPGAILSIADASEIIDSLKGSTSAPAKTEVAAASMVGRDVLHAKFGRGTVTAEIKKNLMVRFADGEKKVPTAFVTEA